MKLFCNHQWNEIKHFIIPSQFDIVIESKKIPQSWVSFKRTYVTDYSCAKCGKLKRFINKVAS